MSRPFNIRHGRPPNFEAILKVFPAASGRNVIFAYAPDVYLGAGVLVLPPHLVAHEAVHVQRQIVMGVEAWWDRYLTDADFRYDEELLAHRAEYQYILASNPSRQVRRSALKELGTRLSSPLYGKMKNAKQAADDIAGGDDEAA